MPVPYPRQPADDAVARTRPDGSAQFRFRLESADVRLVEEAARRRGQTVLHYVLATLVGGAEHDVATLPQQAACPTRTLLRVG